MHDGVGGGGVVVSVAGVVCIVRVVSVVGVVGIVGCFVIRWKGVAEQR